MTLAGFEPAIPASERPQILALDRSATRIQIGYKYTNVQFIFLSVSIKEKNGLMTFRKVFNLISILYTNTTKREK
jgi:hypothetical protein